MRKRPLSKTAVIALTWVLLTTPLTTLPLLYLLERTTNPVRRFALTLPPWGLIAAVGAVLIALPLVGAILGSVANGRIRASWTPVRGGGMAGAALTFGVLAALAGAAILAFGLLG